MNGLPVLSLVTFFPLLGALLIAAQNREASRNARWIALYTTLFTLGVALWIWANFDKGNAGFQFVEEAAWLGGSGCVPIHNLMEDAATAEIARAQLWQWIKHPGGKLDDGRKVTADLVRTWLREELNKLKAQVGDAAYEKGHYERAGKLVDNIATADSFETFITLPAYNAID